MGETCSLQDVALLAECNGRMCTSTNLEGSFDGSSVPPYLLLSFNRVFNFYGDLHQQHHAENLEVILFICNKAMGPSTPVELDNWIKALRVSTYLTDEWTILATIKNVIGIMNIVVYINPVWCNHIKDILLSKDFLSIQLCTITFIHRLPFFSTQEFLSLCFLKSNFYY